MNIVIVSIVTFVVICLIVVIILTSIYFVSVSPIRKTYKQVEELQNIQKILTPLLRLTDCNSFPEFGFKIKVINLKKRNDRLDEFIAKFPFSFINVEIFNAIDGKNEITLIDNFKKNYINDWSIFDKWSPFTSGELGCWLSHFTIWNYIREPTLILEDDTFWRLDNHETWKIWQDIKTKIPNDFDILYIGMGGLKSFEEFYFVCDYFKDQPDTIQSMFWRYDHEKFFKLRICPPTTLSYIITPSCVEKLKKKISHSKISKSIDEYLQYQYKDLKIYICTPLLCFSILDYKTDVR